MPGARAHLERRHDLDRADGDLPDPAGEREHRRRLQRRHDEHHSGEDAEDQRRDSGHRQRLPDGARERAQRRPRRSCVRTSSGRHEAPLVRVP
ncbi:hypothetical protein ABZ567_12345 [Streptomyces sp. NPDC016459]|uniref:hypothetical protein n=1 Tax=Streptomyces sp. NPDC016459 TaxID=3157190 RepID=UPI0033EF4E6B